MAKLIITEDGRDKIYEIVDDVFTIGAGAEADLQLRDDEASELHVEVRKTPQGFRLIDLETKNGTVVNGQAINQHVLTKGDTIEIGETRITYIGPGPAQRAGGGGRSKAAKKTNMQSSSRSHYRRQGAGDGISSGGKAGIALAVLGVVILIGWMLLNSAGVEEPTDYLNLKNALVKMEQDQSETAEKEAKKVLADYKSKYSKLTKDEQDVYSRLQTAVADYKQSVTASVQVQGEREQFARIKNLRTREPNNHQGLIDLCQTYLKDFEVTPATEENREKVEAFLKRATEKAASVTPEDRELAELEAKVAELVWSVKGRMDRNTGEMLTYRRYREAYELVQNASSSLKAMRDDELEKMARKLKKYSRLKLTGRKNEVRHALREGDMAKANRMLDQIFESLIHDGIEAYLEHPDGGYSNPDNARLELETQKLLRERLARYK